VGGSDALKLGGTANRGEARDLTPGNAACHFAVLALWHIDVPWQGLHVALCGFEGSCAFVAHPNRQLVSFFQMPRRDGRLAALALDYGLCSSQSSSGAMRSDSSVYTFLVP